MDRLQQAIRHADGDFDRLALLVMDLDRFKVVNDTMGHDVGDALLQDVGERVRKQVRDPDTVARLGGDEFAVLLPLGGDATIATIVAHKILRALEHPYELEGQRVTVGASIGIALFPEHGDAATTLLRRADVAMYAAKRDRSGYAIYTESFDAHLGGTLSLAADLQLAIERRQLYLEYQPVAELPNGEIKQVEALVRWRHPDRGVLMPDEFIGLAEETGLIKPLTDWVISAALGQCGLWRQRNLDVSVSINIPTPMLQSSFFLYTLEGHLGSLNLDPACLTLEVTETTLMREPDYSVQLLDRLRAMGVRLCIDDFGTGYSSLSHLQRLAVHELKIDRSFVRDLARAPGDVAIVRSTIDLAHRLGLRVVAEGVEDVETWRRLCELGCDAAQGFFISRSLEAGEATRWLAQRPASIVPPEA
jgi:diguanylate cyclase (GGDEF)-like protein